MCCIGQLSEGNSTSAAVWPSAEWCFCVQELRSWRQLQRRSFSCSWIYGWLHCRFVCSAYIFFAVVLLYVVACAATSVERLLSGEPELAGSPSVFFHSLFQKRSFGDKCIGFTGKMPLRHPTVSKHWRELKEHTQKRENSPWASLFLYPPLLPLCRLWCQ